MILFNKNFNDTIMKRIKYIISLIVLVTTIISCSKLNLSPLDYYGSTSFWNNEAQVKGFIYGIHSQLRGAYQYYFLMGEARGGLHKNGTSTSNVSINYSSPIKNNALTSSNTGITGWGGFYTLILNVNLAIQKVQNECTFLSDASRGYYLGQLYGIRAYYYFWLYRTWGGVPIITEAKVMNGTNTAIALYTARSTAKQTLDFIKSDITNSETNFGTNVTINDSKASWSKYATLMLKGEVYLWSAKVSNDDQTPVASDITTAETAISQVISSNTFSLLPSFSNVFSTTNRGNNEIIFTLRFLNNESTNWGGDFTYSDNVFTGVVYSSAGKLMTDTLKLQNTGIQRHEYIWNLWTSFDATDTRKTATFLDFYLKKTDVTGGLVLRKFIGEINSTNARVYTNDIPVYRYSDALLLMAEIQNKKGSDPSSYINQVRARAYGSNYNAAVQGYTNSTYAANELAILFERDKEFVCENSRWFDVIRMQDATGKPLVFSTAVTYGATSPILNPATDTYKLMWPVDVTTLSNDPLVKQTTGY